jgi:acyl dehydratase
MQSTEERGMSEFESWSTTAVNLAEHADNPIHTDAGAIAAGYPRAVIAGTSVYAYLAHPVWVAWGDDWLRSGGGEVRFRRPVFAGDVVDCVADPSSDRPVVTASVAGIERARLEVWRSGGRPPARAGTRLGSVDAELVEAYADYGVRVGDDLVEFSARAIAHPATWIALANRIFLANLVDGPWIHTRSRVHHRAIAAVGAHLHVEASLVDRYASRRGRRALVDVTIAADGVPVAFVEHEALIDLTT